MTNQKVLMPNKKTGYLHSTVRVMLAVSGCPTPLSAEQVYTPEISINIDIGITGKYKHYLTRVISVDRGKGQAAVLRASLVSRLGKSPILKIVSDKDIVSWNVTKLVIKDS